MLYNSIIEGAKAKLDLYNEAVQLLGPPRTITGGTAKWCCPKHDERTPSFGVNLTGEHAGRWRCWGACSVGGDVLDFLTWIRDSSLKAELERLGVRPEKEKWNRPAEITLPDPAGHPALERYGDWLRHRRWTEELADMVGLEFVLDQRHNPRIRFPFRMERQDDKPVFYQDRAMFSKDSPKWMAPQGTVPCPFEAWRMVRLAMHTRTLFICEGLPDVMALLHVNLNMPVIGIPGVGAFKEKWIPGFRGLNMVVVIADNDNAGTKMRGSLAAALEQVLLPQDIHQLLVPAPHKDVDEWRQADPDLFGLHFISVLESTLERADGPSREHCRSLQGRDALWGDRGLCNTGTQNDAGSSRNGHPAYALGGGGAAT